MKKYLKEMRVKHYLKNFLIFLPILFAKEITNISCLLNCFLGFIAFCFISSFVYIINDIQDVEKDRKHPTKCKRPIASGEISIKSATILSIILLVTALILNYIICKNNLFGQLYLILYGLLNFLYSIKLKNYPIIDISILVSGFLFRVLYGGAITGIPISNWLWLTILSASFFLVLGKRRNELQNSNGKETRKVLKYYTHTFLDKNMYMCLSLAIVFYSLWCININSSSKMIWTVPLIIIIFMKYNLTVEGNSDGDPVEVLLSDKILLSLCFLYGLITFGLLYFG